MKTKILFMLTLAVLLASCAPASISTPTETPVSTATITLTPIPPTPTITPTPMPENLADTKDLQIWVEQYVNAYGGKVTVNSVEMDASKLTDAIRNNAESFTQVKEVKGTKYSFLEVNGMPLAIMGIDGKWNEATLKNISSLTDVSFGIGAEPTTDPKYHLYYNFTQKDRDLRFKQSTLAAPADLFQTGEILHKGEGLYDWSRPDGLIARFEKEGLQVRAANIIWAVDSHPDWLTELSKKGMQNPEAYKDQFTKIMREYIKAAVTRYKGKFKDWVLLNELLDAQGNLDQNNFWVKIIGSDIAKIAIQEARNADPNISIVINDYPMLWNDKKTDGMVTWIGQLKQQGLLTDKDALGIQAHDSLLNPKWRNMASAKDELKSTLRRFAQLGIHIRITELDLFDVMSDDAKTREKKAEIYKTIIESCFEINAEFGYPVIDNITTWGIKNDESWQYYVKGKNFGYPLYFDKDFNPEPAFYSMLQVFYENTSK
jgi:endo-1,4-beta-xylanase